MGFWEGRAERLSQLQAWDQQRCRRSAAPAAANNETGSVNYQRLCARAWEEVAKKLAASGGAPMQEEDLRKAYLSVRAELYHAGEIAGRGFDGKAKAPVEVGQLNDDVLPYIINPSKW